jgi:pimeloyl-ACP methyl ester carboxylesterase
LDVHAGYLDASGWLTNEFLRSGDSFTIGNRRVYLGGHSAGGAIAQILALRLYGSLGVKQIYTFGSPKWCSRLTASLYAALPFESFRFVMAGDPVPYLPLNSWRELLGRPGFAHTSLGLEVDDSGQVLSEYGYTTARRLYCAARNVWRYGVINSLIALRRLNEIIVERHGITRYRAAIERAAEVHS